MTPRALCSVDSRRASSRFVVAVLAVVGALGGCPGSHASDTSAPSGGASGTSSGTELPVGGPTTGLREASFGGEALGSLADEIVRLVAACSTGGERAPTRFVVRASCEGRDRDVELRAAAVLLRVDARVGDDWVRVTTLTTTARTALLGWARLDTARDDLGGASSAALPEVVRLVEDALGARARGSFATWALDGREQALLGEPLFTVLRELAPGGVTDDAPGPEETPAAGSATVDAVVLRDAGVLAADPEDRLHVIDVQPATGADGRLMIVGLSVTDWVH